MPVPEQINNGIVTVDAIVDEIELEVVAPEPVVSDEPTVEVVTTTVSFGDLDADNCVKE